MAKAKMSLIEAAAMVRLIDKGLDTITSTIPLFVAEIGGRQALAARCEMTAFGPVPRLSDQEFAQAAREYADRAGWCGNTGV